MLQQRRARENQRDVNIMPVPKPKEKEVKEKFITRCMSDEKMKSEYSSSAQRYAVCRVSWDNSEKEDGEAANNRKE